MESLLNQHSIVARDIPDAWYQTLDTCYNHGTTYTIDRGSFAARKRLELDYITVQIINPWSRPLEPDIPPDIDIPPPVAEGYLDDYITYLMTSAKKDGEEYTYGEYLESQIAEIIRIFCTDHYRTNQACMTIGDAQSIYLDNPPCLRMIDCRISQGKITGKYYLHFFVYFRSWDLWSGFPANLGAIQMLKEYMAYEIGVEDGEIIASSKGLHLYDFTWDFAAKRLRQKS
jgi:thymidylate synthase